MQKFQVINTRTGAVIGTYVDKLRARAARDRSDYAYGAAIHTIREVTATPAQLGAGIAHNDRAGLL